MYSISANQGHRSVLIGCFESATVGVLFCNGFTVTDVLRFSLEDAVLCVRVGMAISQRNEPCIPAKIPEEPKMIYW